MAGRNNCSNNESYYDGASDLNSMCDPSRQYLQIPRAARAMAGYGRPPCPPKGMSMSACSPPSPGRMQYSRGNSTELCEEEDDDEEEDENVCPVLTERGKEPKESKYTKEQEKLKKLETKLLDQVIKDNYCPGVIQDTTNGNTDFNEVVLAMTLEGKQIPCTVPSPEPITLAEAFYKRIQHDRKMIYKGQPKFKKVEAEKYEDAFNEHMGVIDEFYKNQNNTELTRAIKAFIKAEQMYKIINLSKDTLPFTAEIYDGIMYRGGVSLKVYTGNTKPEGE